MNGKRIGGAKANTSSKVFTAAGDDALMERVYERCHEAMARATAAATAPEAFLAALVANESGAEATAARFEPAVYAHLAAVGRGEEPAFGSIRAAALDAEVADLLHPKTASYHARALGLVTTSRLSALLAELNDEALRELATSWGYTQIMGYHVINRQGTLRDLLDADFHFRMAVALLSEFAEAYQLDSGREFREMFCCWNTGRPYGVTFDPEYVEKGLARMEIYRGILAAETSATTAGAQQ